ncbi:MAG: hypothetical protein HQL03_02260 [Nitrospirae bacterium]|nr:hypothetical protein [Nitrospirota bacterium]
MNELDSFNRRLCTDFATYAPGCLKVQSVDGRLLPFRLNEIQLLLEHIILDIRAQGRPVRLLILKARREGVSTWAAGRFYWKTTTHFNRYAVLITHEQEATEFIFNMTRRFHRHIPEDFRAAQLYNNRKEIEFNRATGQGLDGAIRVGTAGKMDFGSGQLIHYLHLSEVAKWPSHTASDLLTSLLQCVPDEPETEVIFESTARGPAGEFYERFFNARYVYEIYQERPGAVKNRDAAVVARFRSRINERSGVDNLYSAVFIPWFVFDSYRIDGGSIPLRPCGSIQGLTQEEAGLRDLYGVDDAQLLWRRQAIENRCGGNLLSFKQEYPSSAVEAFVTTSTSVFNTQKILALMAAAIEPIARYECELSTKTWRQTPEGRLRVWEEPVAGRQYVISADVSEGIEGGDYSCAVCLERVLCSRQGGAYISRQVAQWHGSIEPDLFGLLLAGLGQRYNTALVVPERNNHGLVTITKLVELSYPRIYTEMVLAPPFYARGGLQPLKSRRRLGWLTTRASKELIINNLIAEVRDDCHGIVCRETYEEMLTFVRTQSGQYRAENSMHDDRVMALAIGKFVQSKLPPMTKTTTVSPTIPIEAWT